MRRSLRRSRSLAFLAALLALAASGCASAPSSGGFDGANPGAVRDQIERSLNLILAEPSADTRALDVYYVTNRALVPGAEAGCGDAFFGTTPAPEVRYGTCRINVPKRHSTGTIEVTDNPRLDPHRYFRMISHAPLAMDTLKEAILQTPSANVLVFVHGFNVKFTEALYRAAQISYDLKFQGPIILFSWPAGSGQGFLDGTLLSRTYSQNQASAAASVDAAAEFFKMLAGLNLNLHVLVHSMGHQVVLPALAKAATEIGKPFIRELILNAPDYPVSDFNQVLQPTRQLARRITLYCSYNDNAMVASEMVNKGKRLGACERVDGIDVINVGEIDAPTLGIGGLGHGYYASRPILGDVFQLLLGIQADRRLFIRRSEPNSAEHYFLRP